MPGLGAILAMDEKKQREEEGQTGPSGPPEGLKSAAKEMISAFERKDPDEVARIMQRSFEMQMARR